jgi:hypothetical protein
MSGGEPLWRRVAGLYLSGIPADAKERVSTRGPARDGIAHDLVEDPTQEIIMLGEALDLVTLAQGYRSPAVPLLLRALIRTVRQVAAERAEAAAREEAAARDVETATAEEVAADVEAAERPRDDETAAPDTAAGAEHVPEPEQEAAAADTAEMTETLEERVSQTDQKVSALTAAVGQLVDVLQRRARDGGGVDRRESPRLPGTNAKLFVHGRPYEVVNWSRGGFLIRISEADRFSRGGFDFHFVLDLPDETVEFQGRARPVRIERTSLAAEFMALDTAAAAKIDEIASGTAGED